MIKSGSSTLHIKESQVRKERKKRMAKPNGSGVLVTIFIQGELIKGNRDKYGNVHSDHGNVYQFDKVDGHWKRVTGDPQIVQAQPKVHSRSNLGKIITMDDGSAYQYQEVEGEIVLVCILKNPPKFVSLSYVPGSMHGRIPARSPGR